MNREKTHLYKKQHQQPIEEETPPHKKVLDFSSLGCLKQGIPYRGVMGDGT
jgi:hypothetical protein